jgi:uncharacterized repeat protein (TIGR01451 family)
MFPLSASPYQTQFANGDPGYSGSDIFFTILAQNSVITSIGPSVAGNNGDTTITITGAGFSQSSACSLVQGTTTITATQVVVAADGSSVQCTFALNGASAAAYNLSISAPGQTTITQTGALTVQNGGQPNVWANVLGRSAIRAGTPTTFSISYGNSGTTDAYFTTLWITLSPGLTFAFSPGIQDPFNPDLSYSDQQAGMSQPDSSTQIPLIFAHLPAGIAGTMQIQVTDPTNGDQFGVEAQMTNPWFATSAAASAAFTALENITAPIDSTCSTLPSLNGNQPANCLNYWTVFSTSNVVPQGQSYAAQLNLPFDAQAVLIDAERSIGLSFQAALGQAFGQTIEPRSTVSGFSSPRLRPRFSGPTPRAGYGPDRPPFWRPSEIGPGAGPDWPVMPEFPPPGSGPGPSGFKLPPGFWGDPIVVIAAGWALVRLLDLDYANFAGLADPGLCGGLGRGTTIAPPTMTIAPVPCPPGGTQTLTYIIHCSTGDITLTSPIKCVMPQTPKCPPAKKGCKTGGAGGSIDPNYKSGPVGDGSPSQYIGATAPLTYSVGFENEATASLPAARVVITDQLDPTRMNISTLSLGTISFGANVIDLPTGVNNYTTTYTPSGVTSYQVRIQGSLNTDTGLLTWTFQTIDPTTGLPPTDPTVGFLPPDTDGIVGQGSVTFAAMAQTGLSTGAVVSNQATVTFDANGPITTPVWSNTLDVTPPVSQVAPLPAQEASPSFLVSWSGTDVGSGISTYTIYVSDNGTPFAIWQQGVNTTSATYSGQVGHTYGFFSIATDGAGNMQAAKSVADTTTTVTGPPALSISKTHIGNFMPGQQNATYTVTVSNGSSGGATAGMVTVTESVPQGMTLVSMAGNGTDWNCSGNTCTRSDSLSTGMSYSPITVTVSVASGVSGSLTNQVSVAGGGASATAYANDMTTISVYSSCDVGQYGSTTVADVQQVIDEALGSQSAANDLNNDGVVNVVDIQIVMNSVLGLGCTG